MNKIKVSDYIVQFLVKNGINKCFTVTGGGAMHLNDSFGHNEDIDCIYNHHEQACAMAAEGYTKVSGTPAIVCVTSGPGSTNAITGVLGAWLDSVPMIVLSGQMTTNTILKSTPVPLRQLGFQEFNIIDSVKCMTKYAEILTDVNYVPYHLEKALYLCQTGRKGPVWLDIPLDIQSATIDLDTVIHYNFDSDILNVSTSPENVEFVMNKINSAKRPVLMVGYGVKMNNAHDDFIKVVEYLKIPVVTEWNSNDLIWDSHEYYSGRPGTIGNRGGNFVIQNSDLVLAIGCQFSIRQTSYAWHNFAKNAYKIGVNNDRHELLKPTVKIDYPIHSNVKEFLNLISNSKIQSEHNTNTRWYKWCKQINKKYPILLPDHNKQVSPISVYSFIKTLSDRLNAYDIVVLANGAACVAGLQAIEVKKGQTVFTNAGASSMGYGISAAIGAAYARNNNEKIICIEGDGSIQMNLQELQTIIHNNLDIKIFWINNDGYQSIKQTQTSMFKAKEKGFCGANKDSGISFPSAEKIANAYGFEFIKIDNINDLKQKIEYIYGTVGPVICEVVTDPDEEFKPKLQSKLLDTGKFYTPSLEDMYPFLSKEEMDENKFTD